MATKHFFGFYRNLFRMVPNGFKKGNLDPENFSLLGFLWLGFLLDKRIFPKKRKSKLKSSPRTKRPYQTLAPMQIFVSGQTKLMNSLWNRGCLVVAISSLGYISAIVKVTNVTWPFLEKMWVITWKMEKNFLWSESIQNGPKCI